MTASKIHQEIRKVYPKVTLWKVVDKKNTWCVDTYKGDTMLGEGNTPKRAWVAAYEKVQEELKQKDNASRDR
jgi:hypothetical protein